jgi:UDP-N-acetylmuramoyl-L-alanyl-D-glutamate--2,6-diaminopimelate ligase
MPLNIDLAKRRAMRSGTSSVSEAPKAAVAMESIALATLLPEQAEYAEEKAELMIRSVTADSRQVKAGSLFVAVPGVKQDGLSYVADAVSKGAVAIVSESPAIRAGALAQEVAWVTVPNAREALAQLAARFYQPVPEHIVAVTGTNGKTSVAHFCRELWKACGQRAASIGTLGVVGTADDSRFPALNTTPDPVVMQQTLQQLKAEQIDRVALEASSHGLHQHRLDGLKIQAAAFTNLTRDHLDYHGTEEAYFDAKLILFHRLLPPGSIAVLNADDRRYLAIRATCAKRGIRVWSVGERGEELKILDITPHAGGQTVTARLWGEEKRFDLPLYGRFQISNLLMALGLVVAAGLDARTAMAALPKVDGVRGRMECVTRLPHGCPVFVDYAHTHDALENALSALRKHTAHRLWVVFGCGGDRDKGKRMLMGRVARNQADGIIVTDDNPRTEDPASIREMVLQGCPDAMEIAGRKEAIFHAISQLEAGDVLLIAGKGHEQTQTIGTESFPFDDAAVAQEAAEQEKIRYAKAQLEKEAKLKEQRAQEERIRREEAARQEKERQEKERQEKERLEKEHQEKETLEKEGQQTEQLSQAQEGSNAAQKSVVPADAAAVPVTPSPKNEPSATVAEALPATASTKTAELSSAAKDEATKAEPAEKKTPVMLDIEALLLTDTIITEAPPKTLEIPTVTQETLPEAIKIPVVDEEKPAAKPAKKSLLKSFISKDKLDASIDKAIAEEEALASGKKPARKVKATAKKEGDE